MAAGLLACQGTPASTPSGPASASPTAQSELPAGLPQNVAGYTGWLKLNPEPLPPRADAPHGSGVKNVFVNQPRSALLSNNQPRYPYPEGTLIVKEGLHSQGHLELIAVMRKLSGSDPAHGDWVFEEYIRSGPDGPFRLAFQGSVCWSCHARAQGTDWSFTAIQ